MLKDFNKTAIIAGTRTVSYAEMLQRIHLFATHNPGQAADRIIILSENREGWIYALFSVWECRQIATPVDAGSTAEEVAYILSDCRPVAVWTSRTKLDVVRQAIHLSGIEPQVLLIDDYELAPAPAQKAVIAVNPQATALIIYTSGTTGSPKGVMLSFGNIDANIVSVSQDVPIYSANRRVLILLPLHHVLPLLGSVVAPLSTGGGVAIAPSMSGPDIMDTLCRGQVGIIVGVPRLWQTLYGGIKKKIDAHMATRFLFWLCAKVSSRSLSRLVFGSVHRKMGGHLDFCVSGGAALDQEIGEGLRTLGLDVLEGYGMTEAAPMISFTRPGDIIPGCSGLPLPRVECKIVNGEMRIKGPNVMQGYYNKPDETAEVIDIEGFLHTGDLARFDERGRVYITGRSKELIVLSNGKNIQPSEIEYKLEQYTTQVREAAVVQDSDVLCAIIVPQHQWAAGRTDEQMEDELKRQVIEPYNQGATSYKRLMGVFVYRGDLPRTRLDKLQRYKLREIVRQGKHRASDAGRTVVEPTFQEYQMLKHYLEQEKHQPVLPTHHLEIDLAMDSLDKVSLQGFIEQSFGIVLPIERLPEFRHVLALAEHIAACKTRTVEESTDWHALLQGPATPQALPTPSCTHVPVLGLFGLVFRLYNRLSIRGREHIPTQGPFILAANHESYVDGPLVMSGLSAARQRQCYFYVTEEHVRSAAMKHLANRHNVILMERADLKKSIQRLAQALRQGHCVAIFPEGTRTHTGEMGEFRKMFAILAAELGVPVLPVCISGAYQALPRGTHHLRPRHIQVDYLPTIHPWVGESHQQLADRVRDAIARCHPMGHL